MLSELENKLWEILKQHPSGISEYELLRCLQNDLNDDFGTDLFRDELETYRAHFLLFHALYRLSDYLTQQRHAHLDIHVLKIILLPCSDETSSALSHPDPLRAHYLDLNNLTNTTLEDVQKLLGQFWANYYANQRKPGALRFMGLEISASTAEIEQRYRILAMQYHPDRGGDSELFLQLQQAISTLRQCKF